MLHDAHGQTFYDGALAYSRQTDENRIILLAATENLRHTLNLAVTAHNRVEQSSGCNLRQVCAESVERRCTVALAVLSLC